jgi:hypothetical protein
MLNSYDSHLFVGKLGQDKYDLELIPLPEELYVSFSKVSKIGKKNRSILYRLV